MWFALPSFVRHVRVYLASQSEATAYDAKLHSTENIDFLSPFTKDSH